MTTHRNSPISAEIFVSTWMQAHRNGFTQQWVADQLSVDKKSVTTRVFLLRRRGVLLPELARSRHKFFDVEELNRMIKELSDESK